MDTKIYNIPISSISEVKKSPMDVFRRASKEAEGVYILNRKKIAGVMLTQKQYESLNKETERLYDQISELIAEKRLLNEKTAVFSDIEVRGSIANKEPVIDEADGWE
jgi:PHD/YefM family antitoxin component YafN of YafNO toxin-antitoxin module